MASLDSSSLCLSPCSLRLQSDSVQRWLEDLRHMTEVECMCVLQGKPLGEEEELLLGADPPWPARSHLQLLLRRALVVSSELSRMFSRVERGRWGRTHSTAVRAQTHLRGLLLQYTQGRGVPERLLQYEKILLEKSQELTSITERCVQTEDQSFLKASRDTIHQILTDLSQDFSTMIDLALANEIRVLVEQVERSSKPETVEGAISSLLSLTQDGPQLCSIIAQEGAVGALFRLCRQDVFTELYAPALRTIAALCCEDEGVQQLDKVDGLLVLCDLLTDGTCPEEVKAEAAAVVAQLTSPHHSSTGHLLSFMENMQEIVSALICLCSSASCGEVFLLASAALANITFLDSLSCELLLQTNAVEILLRATRDKSRVDTPYSRDQVVTILANLSVLEQCSEQVLQEQGVEVLLQFLCERPSSSSPSEGAACERVQQKAAVTLARLSRNAQVSCCAVQNNAVPRLIELCRSPTERNNSDSVLVACLAALRRLASVCPESLQISDHQQLIAPRLVDSFLLCSNMEESFV
ncbi:unnamed protein product [Knipowitschia caucasica]|uniref:INSC spindle orientation adaptor protein n=1 Tax=Knipowitschia caucasica TaxID=637954 RepID=A0AAV2KYY3_KNICA